MMLKDIHLVLLYNLQEEECYRLQQVFIIQSLFVKTELWQIGLEKIQENEMVIPIRNRIGNGSRKY